MLADGLDTLLAGVPTFRRGPERAHILREPLQEVGIKAYEPGPHEFYDPEVMSLSLVTFYEPEPFMGLSS